MVVRLAKLGTISAMSFHCRPFRDSIAREVVLGTYLLLGRLISYCTNLHG